MQSMACRARACWNPRAEAATVACLIDAGVDRNTIDNNIVTPLHRAVHMRCAAAVRGRPWRRCAMQGQEWFDTNAARDPIHRSWGYRFARGEGAPKGDRVPARGRSD